jgi:hypothetical protein
LDKESEEKDPLTDVPELDKESEEKDPLTDDWGW